MEEYMFIKSISDLVLSWFGYNSDEEEQAITKEKIPEEEEEGPVGLPLESDDEEEEKKE